MLFLFLFLSFFPFFSVLQNALVHDGLARGLRECAKALDKRQAHLCVLVETCTEGEFFFHSFPFVVSLFIPLLSHTVKKSIIWHF